MNAFVAYEIYILLKRSNIRQRSDPPSIWRVALQAMIAYVFGLFIFVMHHNIVHNNDSFADDNPNDDICMAIHAVFNYTFCVGIPITFLIAICIAIWYQGLIRSMKSLFEGRLRIIALYFGRIVAVEVLVWILATIIYGIDYFANDADEINEKLIAS